MSNMPEPVTRTDYYLQEILKALGSGGISRGGEAPQVVLYGSPIIPGVASKSDIITGTVEEVPPPTP